MFRTDDEERARFQDLFDKGRHYYEPDEFVDLAMGSREDISTEKDFGHRDKDCPETLLSESGASKPEYLMENTFRRIRGVIPEALRESGHDSYRSKQFKRRRNALGEFHEH